MSATCVRPGPIPEKPQKHPKKHKGLRKISLKYAAELRKYWPLRRKFLEEHPRCQFPDCFLTSVEVHHLDKRGKNLLVVRLWKAMCYFHSRWIHDNPLQARELGLLV